MKNLRPFFRRAIAYLFPPKCPACGEVTGSSVEGDLCETCRKAFSEEYVTVCPRCGQKSDSCECAPDALGNEWDRSPFTTVLPLIFDGYYTGYDEDSIVASLVFRMKRNRTSDAKMLFARIIAFAVSRELTIRGISPTEFTVTYIPRSKAAFKKYGFDHMETVAKCTAEMLGCKYKSLLIRKGGTDQKALSADERSANAVSSISADPRKKRQIDGAKLIVLDDIVTTGSTMRAAVSKLSFAGADTVIPVAAMISKKKKQ